MSHPWVIRMFSDNNDDDDDIRMLSDVIRRGYPDNPESNEPESTYPEGSWSKNHEKIVIRCYPGPACLRFRVIRSYPFFFFDGFFFQYNIVG